MMPMYPMEDNPLIKADTIICNRGTARSSFNTRNNRTHRLASGPGQFWEQAHVGFAVMAIRKGGGLAQRLLQ